VLSSYSVDGGPSTIFNATEAATYQFQQKLFQSATLTDSASHTLVVTLVNNGTLYLDYFLVIPSTSTTTSSSSAGASSSNPSSVTGTMMVGGVGSSTLSSTLSTTTGAGAQSQSNRVTIGAAVGGSLGGLALLIIAVLAVFFCRKRRKDKNLRELIFLLFRSCELAMNIFISHRRFSGSGAPCPFHYSRLADATVSAL
jgi:hypothetical protein